MANIDNFNLNPFNIDAEEEVITPYELEKMTESSLLVDIEDLHKIDDYESAEQTAYEITHHFIECLINNMYSMEEAIKLGSIIRKKL